MEPQQNTPQQTTPEQPLTPSPVGSPLASSPVQTDPSQTQENVPSQWPDSLFGFGIFKYSKEAVSLNAVTLLVLFVLGNGFNYGVGKIDAVPATVANILGFLVSAVLGVATTYALLQSVDGKKVSIGEAVGKTPRHLVSYLIAQILVTVSIILGLLLLIVPGVILAIRLSLVNYFVVDKDMGPIDAYKASLAAVKGNSRVIVSILLAAFVYTLLLLTILGIPVALYLLFMFSSAAAIAYRYLTREGGEAGQSAAPIQQPPSPVGPQTVTTPPQA